MLKCILNIVVFSLFCVMHVYSQSSSVNKTEDANKSKSSLNTSADELIQSLSDGKTPEEISVGYYNLSVELFDNGEFAKAEFYINKAIQVEKDIKKSKKIAEYYRQLGRIQEALKNTDEAANSFEKAAELSDNSLSEKLNRNDANRLKYRSTPEVELGYLKSNAGILDKSDNKQEKVQNYYQQADVNVALNNKEQAIEDLNLALVMADSTSVQSMEIKSDIANLWAENKDYNKAIEIQNEVVKQSLANADVETQVQQLRNLSNLYFAKESADEGLEILIKAYQLSLEKGNLKEAKSSLEMLVDYYEKNKDNKEVVELYRDFVANLESLISRDNSLFDKKLFHINEEKISQLEKEKVLKDELIGKKSMFNYVLIGSVLLLIFLLALIIKAWYSIRRRNKRIALQSLRREMNPHFIYNSLNSVNQFIAKNNELEANKYLISYSNLMRNIMENSNKDYVTLNTELEQLNKYLELEKLRFADKFEYKIEVDDGVDSDIVMVPNMVIQPNLENAIWHGLRYRETKGLLKLRFSTSNGKTSVLIDDNGIGMEESSKIKTQNQKMHESRGLKNVKERIRLLNDIYKKDIRFEITDKTAPKSGVIVKIDW